MKPGTRVEVNSRNAECWGYEIPAIGTVIGPDPNGNNPEVVSVKLDQKTPSIYEIKGCNIKRLKAL